MLYAKQSEAPCAMHLHTCRVHFGAKPSEYKTNGSFGKICFSRAFYLRAAEDHRYLLDRAGHRLFFDGEKLRDLKNEDDEQDRTPKEVQTHGSGVSLMMHGSPRSHNANKERPFFRDQGPVSDHLRGMSH